MSASGVPPRAPRERSKSRDIATSTEERASEQRPEETGVAAERDRATERPDGLAGAIVVQQRLAEAPEDVGRRRAILGVLDAEAEDLFALLVSPRCTQAEPRRPSPLAMRARGSGVSICPSGVRRKIASGAGHAPEQLKHLGVAPCRERAASASATRPRSMAAARAAGHAIELLAHVRADAHAEVVELVLLLDAVVDERELGRRRQPTASWRRL